MRRVFTALLAAAALATAYPSPADPLAHTYSIVARDPDTGEMGVAVQSHWFSVGSIVMWAEAGAGAIATQSFVDPGYGLRGLELLRQGLPLPVRQARVPEDRPTLRVGVEPLLHLVAQPFEKGIARPKEMGARAD